MRKKQLLKLGNGKRGKVVKGVALSLVIGVMAANGVMAGNTGDTSYSYNTNHTNAMVTSVREKEDYTSSYIYHKGNVSVHVQVCSSGVNYTVGDTIEVSVGEARYLPNYVKENGRNNCYLRIYSTTSLPARLYGVWSPDSV